LSCREAAIMATAFEKAVVESRQLKAKPDNDELLLVRLHPLLCKFL